MTMMMNREWQCGYSRVAIGIGRLGQGDYEGRPYYGRAW